MCSYLPLLLTEQISVGAQGSVWAGKIQDLQVVLKILGHGQSSEFFNTEYAAVCVAIITSGLCVSCQLPRMFLW